MFGARTIIIWEDQLVDPAIHYLTSVNALLLAFKVARRYGSSMPMILHDFNNWNTLLEEKLWNCWNWALEVL